MKTYSVILNWNDRDSEEGTYGTTVRAENHEEAEKLARREMYASYYEGDDEADDENEAEDFGGSVVECSEGAHWLASRMEELLRNMLAASDANDGDSLLNGLEQARAIIAEIDRK